MLDDFTVWKKKKKKKKKKKPQNLEADSILTDMCNSDSNL